MRQVIPIPADRAAEFDLTVDIAIRPRTSFDDSRAWVRLRIPLNKVVDELLPGVRVVWSGELDALFRATVENLVAAGIVIPDKAAS